MTSDPRNSAEQDTGGNDDKAKANRSISADTVVSIKIQHLIAGAIGLVAILFGAFLFIDDRYARTHFLESYLKTEVYRAEFAKVEQIESDLEQSQTEFSTFMAGVGQEIVALGDATTLLKRLDSVCYEPKRRDQDLKRLLEEMRSFIQTTMYNELVKVEEIDLTAKTHGINTLKANINKFEEAIGVHRDYCYFGDGGS